MFETLTILDLISEDLERIHNLIKAIMKISEPPSLELTLAEIADEAIGAMTNRLCETDFSLDTPLGDIYQKLTGEGEQNAA